MSSYQSTLTNPRTAGGAAVRSALRTLSTVMAVLIALIVLAVALELTMGYGLDATNGTQPRPIPANGL
jgi:hypothetical protein